MYIASGSEDGKVYIWYKYGSHPLHIINGHSKNVNYLEWHPI
jgi:WD40 repeat protein